MVRNKILIQKVSLLVSDGLALFLSLVIASWLLDLIRPGSNEVSLAVFGLAKKLAKRNV